MILSNLFDIQSSREAAYQECLRQQQEAMLQGFQMPMAQWQYTRGMPAPPPQIRYLRTPENVIYATSNNTDSTTPEIYIDELEEIDPFTQLSNHEFHRLLDKFDEGVRKFDDMVKMK